MYANTYQSTQLYAYMMKVFLNSVNVVLYMGYVVLYVIYFYVVRNMGFQNNMSLFMEKNNNKKGICNNSRKGAWSFRDEGLSPPSTKIGLEENWNQIKLLEDIGQINNYITHTNRLSLFEHNMSYRSLISRALEATI